TPLGPGEGRRLGVKERVAEKGGGGGGRAGRDGPRRRPADAPADPPSEEQSQNSDRRAHQAAGLEQRERQKLGGKRREQIEAAAVVIEIHPRQRALVAQTREIEFEQEIPVFGMRI